MPSPNVKKGETDVSCHLVCNKTR